MNNRNGKEEIKSVSISEGLDGIPKIEIGNSGNLIRLSINGNPGIVMNDYVFLGIIAEWQNQPRELVFGNELPPEYFVKDRLLAEE